MLNQLKWLFLSATLVSLGLITAGLGAQSLGQRASDAIQTTAGELRITPLNHASLMLEFAGKVIQVDPVSAADRAGLRQADLILITDIHGDHMDRAMIDKLKKSGTVVLAPAAVQKTITEAQTIANGEKKTVAGIEIEAVPMYNLTRGPAAGQVFHDKGRGNGYILTLGGKRLYLSGDTECIPEMKALGNIDIAFICMNLPYTMTPGEAAGCAKEFRPKIVYPYHHRGSDAQEFANALQGTPGVEVRIRPWY
ncbi:MAG: MBL fold metallo-hydrolase [Acidobacteria bacterium]|nr:MBL fold metallo-hydrolase [Acidobacteriota bacterium]